MASHWLGGRHLGLATGFPIGPSPKSFDSFYLFIFNCQLFPPNCTIPIHISVFLSPYKFLYSLPYYRRTVNLAHEMASHDGHRVKLLVSKATVDDSRLSLRPIIYLVHLLRVRDTLSSLSY